MKGQEEKMKALSWTEASAAPWAVAAGSSLLDELSAPRPPWPGALQGRQHTHGPAEWGQEHSCIECEAGLLLLSLLSLNSRRGEKQIRVEKFAGNS